MTTVDANRPSVDRALKDVAEITKKLNASADKIDGVLASAQSFLGDTGTGEKAGGMMKDIADAAKSMRKLADNLDGRTKEITAGINRFTGPVAREYEALAVEGRRAVGEIGRAARSLERNPSQVIFGGKSAVPEYAPAR
jgi:phospholipid/cholesterol/gamma-HCH transport system substrate-binding protein